MDIFVWISRKISWRIVSLSTIDYTPKRMVAITII